MAKAEAKVEVKHEVHQEQIMDNQARQIEAVAVVVEQQALVEVQVVEQAAKV